MEALEVVCDESGYEGEKLIDTTTDVFAHAGVHLPAGVAAECLSELRRRVRSPATQYKANHLLREKHRPVLVWFLGPSSPLFRNAHVYLIDKAYFLLGKLTDLFLAEPVTAGLSPDGAAREATDRLYRRVAHPFLVAANDLMRGKDRQDVRGPVDAFFDAAAGGFAAGGFPAGESAGGFPAGESAGGFAAGGFAAGFRRGRAEAFRVRLQQDPSLSLLDPLIPALMRAVARWGAGGRPVTILHDRQTMLPADRVAALQRTLRHAGLVLTRVDHAAAEAEPRVQLADILAGTVRKIAQDELHGRGDRELMTLARPYLDAHAIWGDRRSWAVLAGAG